MKLNANVVIFVGVNLFISFCNLDFERKFEKTW